tara:strand:- start:528 stop:689 length:162 start_codon:yes stop_codon:yes gene_type:complete
MLKAENMANKSIAMFTYIIGYCRIVAKNEGLSLDLIDEHNKIIFPIIKIILLK